MKTILIATMTATIVVRVTLLWLDYRRAKRNRAILNRLKSEEAWYSSDGKDQDLTQVALWIG